MHPLVKMRLFEGASTRMKESDDSMQDAGNRECNVKVEWLRCWLAMHCALLLLYVQVCEEDAQYWNLS